MTPGSPSASREEDALEESRSFREYYEAEVPPGERLAYVANVSFPRSGHHLLIRLLARYFGRRFGYCERYGPSSKPDRFSCCGAFPCAKRGLISTSKNHDFEHTSVLPEGMRVIVQFREPVAAIVSDFELYVAGGNADTDESFRRFAMVRTAAFARFRERWIDREVPGRLLVDYDDLAARPADVLRVAILHFGDSQIDEERLARVIASTSRITMAGKRQVVEGSGVKARRDVRAFRFYVEPLFAELAERANFVRPPSVLSAAPAPAPGPAQPPAEVGASIRAPAAPVAEMARRILSSPPRVMTVSVAGPPTPAAAKSRRAAALAWQQSIDLGDGVVTAGHVPADRLVAQAERIFRPPPVGAAVLVVEASDGHFAFEATRRGARRVVATHRPVWGGGPEGFAFAQACLGLAVDSLRIDPAHVRAETVGTFDIVVAPAALDEVAAPGDRLDALAAIAARRLVVEVTEEAAVASLDVTRRLRRAGFAQVSRVAGPAEGRIWYAAERGTARRAGRDARRFPFVRN